MSEIRIDLTMKQIYNCLCPKCREALIKLAAVEATKKQTTASLERKLKSELESDHGN